MIRTLAISVIVFVLAGGCVTIVGPTQPASVVPTLGVTTPRPVDTATPAAPTIVTTTPTPVPPTATAQLTAAPTPTDAPTVGPIVSPAAGQADLIIFDDMEDPSSGWGLLEQDNVSIAYAEGNLRMSIREAYQALWSDRALSAEYGVLLVTGAFGISGDAGVGALCVTANDELYGATYKTDGSLVFFSIIDNTINVLESTEALGVELPELEAFGFGIECAGTSTGALRMAAVMQNRGVLGVYQSDEGPESFSSVALYAESLGGTANVDILQAGVYGIAGSADGPSTDGEELLSHVPDDWQQQCVDTPSTNAATIAASCFLQLDGPGAEFALFQDFETKEEMDAAYQETVAVFGVESTETSCATGAREGTWTRDEITRGRLQCAPQGVGIRFDWTDDVFFILSTLFDLEGDYENTYNLWTEAGPF